MCVSKNVTQPFLNPSQESNTGQSGMVNTPIAAPAGAQVQPSPAAAPQSVDPNQNPSTPNMPNWPGIFPGMFPGQFPPGMFPSMQKGGPVPKTGLYKLHKGEEVIPAGKGRRGRFRGFLNSNDMNDERYGRDMNTSMG